MVGPPAANRLLCPDPRGAFMTALAVPTQNLNTLTHDIIGSAIEVHRCLGPGLLESIYLECLCHELRMRNIVFDREVSVPLRYKGLILDDGYRLDLLVAGCIVVELKSVEKLLPIHEAQLLSYLKLKRLPLGLLLNFNVATLRAGIVRIAN
jgi:GxxExxY protein